MNPNYLNAARNTITRNVKELDAETDNIYKSIVVMSKRANQIAVEIKEEINDKLEEFTVSGESIEEVYENREQIEMSKRYERLPKPAAIAIMEMQQGRIVHRTPVKTPAADE